MNKLAVIILIFCSVSAFAQKPETKDHTVGYHHHFLSSLQINTRGWGGGVRRSYHQTVRKKWFYEVDLVTLKHPREVKLLPLNGADGFVFAKLNRVFVNRIGWGQHHILAFKPLGEGVEVKTIYSLGLSTAFLKPVYYNMAYANNADISVERFDENVHDLFNIVSQSNFFKGFGQMTVQPGIYGKFALNFEYAAERTAIRAIEVGAVVDAYYKKLPILAFTDNYPVFVSFYASLQYGRKWYR